MKDPHDLLRKKELDVKRVRREIAALHNVISILAESSDCAEYGLATRPSSRGAAITADASACGAVIWSIVNGTAPQIRRSEHAWWSYLPDFTFSQCFTSCN